MPRTEQQREASRRYNQSEKGRLALKKANHSPKGKARRHYLKKARLPSKQPAAV